MRNVNRFLDRFFVAFFAVVAACPLLAQVPRDFAVDLSAAVSNSAPNITLSWSIRRQGNITAQKIHRRLKGETTWVKQTDLTTNQTSYADGTAAQGVEYEYWMERTCSGIYPTTAMGYLSAGMNVPMVESRGTLLLVVDSTMTSALAPEIDQLKSDLTGDGWTVQTITALRTDTAANVRAQIKTAYSADTNHVKMVYLLGHVPVPYSGDIAPDGHGNHVGAWPTDGYYGDMDGTWTDTSVNDTSASDSRNDNIPGDGKFDQSYFPVLLKLMVGRVDLQGMTRAPSSSVSESSLLRRYLKKAHDYRFKQGAYASISRRSIMRDGFGYFSGENFAIAGWSWFFTGVGSQVDEPGSMLWFDSAYAGGKSYLVGYGNGGGSYEYATSVGTSADFGRRTSLVVFTSMFGSYFGDWDIANNFLRAPLAGNATGNSLGLTCFWGGRPNRFTHHMGMGETAGYAMLISQNGSLTGGGNYTPNNYAGTHTGLMGDPALRLHVVEPPRNLAATSSDGQIVLAWSSSTETNLQGYHVFRATTNAGPFTRLTSTPLASTAYTDTVVTAGQSYSYLVRTLKLETSPGGTYYNLSVGAPVTLTASAGATAVPNGPGALSVASSASTNAALAWTDTSGSETGFRIERKTNASGTFAAIGSAAANATNFTDAGTFASGNVYYYRVVATNTAGDSLASPTASFDAVAGYFDLNATKMKVAKSTGTAVITVNRFGGCNGAVSVNYATSDSSAYAGTHYTASSGTLTWSDGETNSKTVSVALLATASPQPARQFRFTLSSPSGGTGLGVFSSAAVLIEDSSATLAAPWSQTIVGGITDYSAAVLADGVIGSTTMGGGGVSTSANSESGRFVYQSRTGDGIMTAYFPAGIPSDSGARFAVMVRASTGNTAVMAASVCSSSTSAGSFLATRTSSGAYCSVLPATANTLVVGRWMRLTRVGSLFTAETSSDGSAWTALGSATVSAMPNSALWGIFHFSSDWASSTTYSGNYQLATAQSLSLVDVPVPASPSGVVAVATSPSTVSLSWPTVGSAAGYRIERCTESGSFTQIVDVAAMSGTSQTYADATVVSDTAYGYRLTAYNGTGSSAASALVYVTTPVADVVSQLTASSGGGADATVRRDFPGTPLGLQTNLCVAGYDPDTWSFLTNAAKTYLRFDLSGVTNTITGARLKLAFIGASRFADAGFYSMAVNLLSDSSDSWSESAITWTNAPQNYQYGPWFSGSYAEVGGTDWTNVLPAAGEVVAFDLDASYLNSNRGADSWVSFGICDYNGGALTEWASREHPTYAAPTLEVSVPSPLPIRPGYFTATLLTGWRVALNWVENATNETSLQLERSVNGGGFSLLQTLPSNATNYLDSPVLPETVYAYRVRTVNGGGASSWSPVATVTTPDVFHAVGSFWDAGGGVDTGFGTAANWDTDSLPPFDGTFVLNFASAGAVATVNTNVSLPGFNLVGSNDFAIADGGCTVALGSYGVLARAPAGTARTYWLGERMAFGCDQTWCVTNVGGAATALMVTGPLSDGTTNGFGLTKTGDGMLTLAGSNSYSGVTVVGGNGGLRVAHARALGGASGDTLVSDGGWLEVSNGVTVAEPLRLNGSSTLGGAGALRSVGGSNVWSGAVTLLSAARVRVSSGALTLAGGVSGSGALYLAPDSGTLLGLSGVAAGLAGQTVYARGGGTVSLGAAGNAWGTLDVQGATVRMDADNALPAGAILSVGGSDSASGALDLNGHSQTVSQLKRGTANAGVRLVTSAAAATLTVSGSTSTTWDGALTGALGLAKAGSSTLTVNGTNTYTGPTTVSAGSLTVNAGANLGASTNVTVSGGYLRIYGADCISDAATLSISGGKVTLGSGVVETIATLVLDGGRKSKGTWGSSSSSAEHVDDVHFTGAGVVYVPTGTSSAWDGGGANTYVDNASNWDYDTVPALDGTSYLSFGVGGDLATVNTDIGLQGLCFNRAGSFAIAGGAGTLTLGSGGVLAKAPDGTAPTYTLGAQVTFGCDQTWCVTNSGGARSTLVVTGALADSGTNVFGLTKTGDGVLALAGDSTYRGVTVVPSGCGLRVMHAHGLGSVSGDSLVLDGGWMEVSNNVTVAEPLRLYGTTTLGGSGALRSVGGTNVWSGAVALQSASRVGALASCALTLAGGVSGGSPVYLGPDPGALLCVTGQPVNVAGQTVYVCGGGTVALGSVGNAWTTLDVQGSTARTDADGALPSGSILSVGGANSADGCVDLNGHSQTVSQLKRGTSNSGTRLVTSGRPAMLTVNGSTGTTWDGAIAGALGLTKSGTSTLYLNGKNTCSGPVVVNGGTLSLNAGATLQGCGEVDVLGGTMKVFGADVLPDTAVVRIADGGAKLYLGDGVVETVGALHLGGVRARRGSWGASGSGAANIDSVHFSGTGMLLVLQGPETVLMVR